MKTSIAFILLLSLVCANSARAGFFDCNVVYDEFENLMNRQFLMEPGLYVPVVEEIFTRGDYYASQRGVFHLYPNRKYSGVVVVATNRNTHGKLLLDWEHSPTQGVSVLKITDGILYGRVSDGYAPKRLAPTIIRSGFAIDLDSGQLTEVLRDQDGTPQPTDKNADILVGGGEQTLHIEAINDAGLWFPLESMCVKLE